LIGRNTLLKLMILEKLRDKNQYVVRELAWDIGTKPEYVNMLISDLKKNYLIDVDKGVVYWNPADNPSTLKPWGWSLEHKMIVGSTQEVARGRGPWSVVIAEYMLLGRGRHGKKWVCSLGGLWITFKLPVDPVTASLAPIILPVILVRIFRKNYDLSAGIKWPNDIIIDGKKIAGILLEAEAFKDQILLYIGIGLNINNDPPLEGTTSLKEVLGRLTPRNRFLSLLIGWIARLKKLAEGQDEIRKSYIEYLETLNKTIVAKTYSGEIRGKVVDVGDSGELIVETEKGLKILDPVTTIELRHIK